jgi:hypothetical protein
MACRNFPPREIWKPEMNVAAFHQASLPDEFVATHSDVGPARAVSDHIIASKPRKNPVLSAIK